MSKIDFSKILIFDGAMGTMLQRYGIKSGELPESYNITHPEIIESIHKSYIDAGADIITTNTFGANSQKLKAYNYTLEQIITEGVKIARKAAGDKYVALDIGPIGQLMEPCGTLTFEKAYGLFAEQVKIGAASGADLILIETMSDLYEAKAAILAAKENCCLPVICTMTFQNDGRTLTGTDAVTMVNVLQGLNIDAVGINCSLGPVEMLPLVNTILEYSKIPVIVQPNAGLPKVNGSETLFSVGIDEFIKYIKLMAESGVTIIGGCCGTNPDYISSVKAALSDIKAGERKFKKTTCITSNTESVFIGDGIKIIGERINPTGKKKIKEALRANNLNELLLEGINQRDAGADILDVNVGLPEINEMEVMIKTIRKLQSVIDLPLQIDSARADVLEAAARIYNGKPLINSVSGKDKSMKEIFPIVKKYGACVIGLTLDDSGIPEKAEERLKIAEKIIKTAESYGIDKNDIIIDCLVLTASAQQEEVKETIKAVSLVKEKLGVKTALGISNVSFGLPKRELLNRVFLSSALTAGLDLPILNPLSEVMIETVKSFNVLWNYDKQAKEFISTYSDAKDKTVAAPAPSSLDLSSIIISGMKDLAAAKTEEMLSEISSMEIVDKYLIPSLNIVGKKYESGEIFLPQLIQSAETVKKSFEVIKSKMIDNKEENISKGKILLATVYGDIHDIGKNIVKVLLENYCFEVIDMGKDVPAEEILKKVKEEDIKLVGLSALMTTTVKNMEDTIKLLRENNVDCKIMVGGAVLTNSYAKMIGADFYASDARQGVKIALDYFN
ncbi:MAG: homocysteine S-methyltransferase family protein [Clostridiaceae bacterium]